MGTFAVSTTYGFFLGPNCKAPEHARFLLEGEDRPSSVVEVDMEMGNTRDAEI